MIDLSQLLIYFLSIVCAPAGTEEIAIIPEHGEARYFVRKGSEWKEYFYDRPQNYTLERLEEVKEEEIEVRYVGKYTEESTEIILTERFEIPNEIFEEKEGIYLIPTEAGGVVFKKRKEGMNVLYENPRRENIFIRWKKEKR